MAIKRITTNLIKDSDIATVDIANNAITAAKITDGNITTAKLADLSVTAGKLAGTLDLTGKTITVATATTGDSDTSPASTAFVQQEIAALVDSSPSSLNTLNELAAALGDDASFSTTVTNSIALKAPLASPDFTGDVTFDTSTLVVDATNNRVGIGTTSPDGKVHIESSSSGATVSAGGDELILESSTTTGLSILSGTANDGNILFGDSGNSAIGYVQYKHADNALNFGVNGGTKATIDSSGNVGIGTTSPVNNGSGSQGLTINGTGNYQNLNLQVGGTTQFTIYTNGVSGTFINQVTADPMMFYTSDTEAMRIDHEQFVLIGKTSSANVYTTAGIDIRPSGTIFATRDQAGSLVLSRTTNDGEISNFRKDGSSVGSIGTKGGDLYIGTGVVGLRFHDSTGSIRPMTTVDGTVTDDTIDLGAGVARFQDLYLSGGAYLGGTGSANHLDDYEEGTWTPDLRNNTTSLSTQTWQYGPQATYTKIGDLVFIHLSGKLSSVAGTGSGELRIFGLPYTPQSTGGYQEYRMSFVMGNQPTASHSNSLFAFVRDGGNDFGCRISDGADTVFRSNMIDSDTFFTVYGCYKT